MMKSFAVLCLLTAVTAQTESVDELLQQHQVRILGSRLAIEGESEFRSQLTKSSKLKRTLQDAVRRYEDGQRQLGLLERNIALRTQANVQINAQLAATSPANTSVYNRLVSANNANIGQIELMQQQLQRGRQQLEELRAAANQAQEEFIEFVLESRQLADTIEDRRLAAAADEELQAALQELNTAEDKEYSLDEPSRAFTSSLKKLEELEASVLTETIAIRRDAGGTATVSVVVNGEKPVEMVVDSGASIITLPVAQAEQLNITVGPEDPPITLVVADGRQISGRLVQLKTVRVGQFVVEDVDCAILGPDAPNAEPLLGMSFLGKFEFQINSADQTLTLTRVESEDNSRRRR